MKPVKTVHFLQSMPIYRLDTNSDTTEGRGNRIVLGYFEYEHVAKAAGRGQYVMGTDCPITTENVPVVVLHMEDASVRMFRLGAEIDCRGTFKSPEDIRKEALAKLTDEEKIVLGLK